MKMNEREKERRYDGWCDMIGEEETKNFSSFHSKCVVYVGEGERVGERERCV